jgi:hypothetical protein
MTALRGDWHEGVEYCCIRPCQRPIRYGLPPGMPVTARVSGSRLIGGHSNRKRQC